MPVSITIAARVYIHSWKVLSVEGVLKKQESKPLADSSLDLSSIRQTHRDVLLHQTEFDNCITVRIRTHL